VADPLATARSKVQTFRAYRNHRNDPEAFYQDISTNAADALAARYPLRNATVLDLGCGPGYYLEALRRHGATAFGVEMDDAELRDRNVLATGALLGDGTRLPFATASFDGVVCSNMLEHTPTPMAVLHEVARVLKPGGWAYVSWTPWYSPWGGHDMNPYQYLGPRLGPRVYERFHGEPRKNRYGQALWAAHVGPIVRDARQMPSMTVERVEARYWPSLSFVTRIPGVREVATGNCVISMRRTPIA
jgi:SAM-dependent methyltransferase